jgi:hypothetical protein
VPIFDGHSFTINELIHLVCTFLEAGHNLLSVKEQNQVRHSWKVRRAEGINNRWTDVSFTWSSNCPQGTDSRPRSSHCPKLLHPTEMWWIGGDLLSSPDYVFNRMISSI